MCLDETVLQSLTSITRRTNTHNSVSQQQPDALQIIMEFLRTGIITNQVWKETHIFYYFTYVVVLINCTFCVAVNPTLERSHSVEFNSNDPSDSGRASTSGTQVCNVNGFNRYTNGQKMDSPPTRAASTSGRIQNVMNNSGRSFPSPNAAPQSPVTPAATPAPPPAPATPAFPPYHPGIPPPSFRPYFPNQPYSGPTPTSK